jgi:AraC family transcriptional regulator, dual regulator of chb operon
MTRLIFATLAARRGAHHIDSTRVGARERTFVHTHDFPEIFLVLEGGGTHHWNGRPVPVARGDLVLILPRDVHCFECGPDESFQLINLALDPAWWRTFTALSGRWPAREELRHRRLPSHEAGACGRQLKDLLTTHRKDPAILVETVASLIRALRADPEPVGPGTGADPSRAPDWLQRLVVEMRSPEASGMPLSFWQRRSNRSPEHLARSCRRFLGCTLTDIRLAARLERVKAGLRDSAAKVDALAYDAGFQNLGYFYRAFRKAEGCTPKQWALAHASGPTVPR